MDRWYGPIQVEKIGNKLPAGQIEPGKQDFALLETINLKFVHYAGCQQLIIWLPRPGREYGQLRLLEKQSGKVAEEWPVSDKLNGAIQILWDTLTVKPGSYLIEIGWKEGYYHIIHFTKYGEGEAISEPETGEKIPEESSGSIVYRDGFGHMIGEEDLRLRERIMKDILPRFSRTVEYHSEGRSGTIVYVEGDTRINFYYELGGGHCVAWIDIPTKQQWQISTKTSPDRRDDIIDFVARRVRDQQASDCRIEISDTSISFMKK